MKKCECYDIIILFQNLFLKINMGNFCALANIRKKFNVASTIVKKERF